MMPSLEYRSNELYMDDIPLMAIIKKYGTPSYIYSFKTIQEQALALKNVFADLSHKLFFAVKANNNLAILNQFVNLNIGFDVVSIGELKRAMKAGANADSIIFSGVGKRKDELEEAILREIHCINVESKQELELIITLAKQLNKKPNLALRINPNVDAHTHENISTGLTENKFGILADEVKELVPLLQSPAIRFVGIACHIGSQITRFEPFKLAAKKMIEIFHFLQSCNLTMLHLDLGGGLGISYDDQPAPSIQHYADAITPLLKPLKVDLYLEPGRLLIGAAACLTTEVLFTKEHQGHSFAILDAGMNDFMRPALYGATHQLHPVQLTNAKKTPFHIVGPVCESTDSFAKNYPLAVKPGDYLVIDSVGAYGSSMSSRYNARPLIPEILIKDQQFFLIRKRETLENTYQDELVYLENDF